MDLDVAYAYSAHSPFIYEPRQPAHLLVIIMVDYFSNIVLSSLYISTFNLKYTFCSLFPAAAPVAAPTAAALTASFVTEKKCIYYIVW